ncbi:glycosyltransferase family 4 protein [bacterium]|nr:glycosyltransferase family 4 protein [candidate division CSSED10-310 bacterium]
MRIGFLTERMILGFGVDLVVAEVARRFSSSGHSVTVFTTRVGEIYGRSDFKIVNLRDHMAGSSDIFSPHFMTGSLNYLATCDIDVWIAETPPFYNWLTFLRPPVIMIEHGTPDGKFFPDPMGRDLDRSVRYRHEVIFQSQRPGDATVAISEYIRSGLPDGVREKTRVIRNGGDHYGRASAMQIRDFRTSLGISTHEIMILWVGRIEPFHDWQPYKGLKEFMKLAPVLKRSHPECRIVAVGRAEENARQPLEKAGIEPVFNLSSVKMPGAYAAADLFVNTSRWEGFNLPLIEAQFQGTPVIAYNLCAHPEVVKDGESGILVHTPDQLLQAAGRLIRDAQFRRRLAEGAERHAAGFTWDQNARDLETLMTECLQTAQSSGQRMEKAARVQKLPPYYLWKTREIIHRYGWMTFLREMFGWIQRRMPWKRRPERNAQ